MAMPVPSAVVGTAKKVFRSGEATDAREPVMPSKDWVNVALPEVTVSKIGKAVLRRIDPVAHCMYAAVTLALPFRRSTAGVALGKALQNRKGVVCAAKSGGEGADDGDEDGEA